MIQIEPFTSLDQPELQAFRTLRRSKDLERRRVFVVEGGRVIERLLESPLEVISLLLSSDWMNRLEPLLRRRPESIRVFLVTQDQIERLTGHRVHQGVKAMGRVAEPPTPEAVLRTSAPPRSLVALDGLVDAENVGGIVRSCAAFGVQAILVGNDSASPWLTRAIRTSMGAVFQMPIVDGVDLPKTLRQIRAAGVRCVAADPDRTSVPLSEADLSGDCCLVFGNEASGLSPEIRACCDLAVAIPMESGVDSLNVGNAAAVFLYELARHRASSRTLRARQ